MARLAVRHPADGGRSMSVMRLAPMAARRIAVVIPCYRVTAHVCPLIARIGPEVSLIFAVDDACPDRSGDHIEANCRDPRLTVIRHEVNRGVGGAVMSGYRAALQAGAEVIVKLDGDGQMDPALLLTIAQPVIEGRADYAKGNRFHSVWNAADAGRATVRQCLPVVPDQAFQRILDRV
jgi:glycosyltransferase involved in cell wall biosynthesis